MSDVKTLNVIYIGDVYGRRVYVRIIIIAPLFCLVSLAACGLMTNIQYIIYTINL